MATVAFRKDQPKLRARLGETLLKLQASLERSRQQEEDSLLQFIAWQSQWTTRRDLIARRLTQIDSELARLSDTAESVPHLSLVSGTVRQEGVTSMGPL